MLGPIRKGLIAGCEVSSFRPLFPISKMHQGIESSAIVGGTTSSNSGQITPPKSLA